MLETWPGAVQPRAWQERAVARYNASDKENFMVAATPVWAEIRAAAYELDRAEGLVTTNVGQSHAAQRIDRAAGHIAAAWSMLRELGAGE